VHALIPTDASQRIRFCKWMLKNVCDGLIDPQLPYITDEHLIDKHLSSYVHSQDAENKDSQNT
jgi:hypothetical protein